MNIRIDKDECGNIITMQEDTKVFIISFAGNLDLYWLFDDLSEDYHSNVGTFYITKENYFVYSLFEKLYEDVSNCNIHNDYRFELSMAETLEDLRKIDRKRVEDKESLKRLSRYKELYNNGIVTWFSDDRDYREIDKVEIKKEEEVFLLKFSREKREDSSLYSDSHHEAITIRFRNDGSSYAPFNCLFMDMYNALCEYDFDDKQIHIEEYMYLVKKKKATH